MKEARGAEPSHLPNFDKGALKKALHMANVAVYVTSYWTRVQIRKGFNPGSFLQFPRAIPQCEATKQNILVMFMKSTWRALDITNLKMYLILVLCSYIERDEDKVTSPGNKLYFIEIILYIF